MQKPERKFGEREFDFKRGKKMSEKMDDSSEWSIDYTYGVKRRRQEVKF